MADYPSLSVKPDSLDPDGTLEKNVIVSPMNGGYEITRKQSTRDRRNFGLKYDLLSADDTELLRVHERLMGQAASFNWTHPISAEVIVVRYTDPIKFSYADAMDYTGAYYKAEVSLREV